MTRLQFEYLRIRRINPHIKAWRVLQYLRGFNGCYPWPKSEKED